MTVLTESISLGTVLTITGIVITAAIGVGYYKGQTEKWISDNNKTSDYLNSEIAHTNQTLHKEINELKHSISKMEDRTNNLIKELTHTVNNKLEKMDILFKDSERKYDDIISIEISKLLGNLKDLEEALNEKDIAITKRMNNIGGELGGIKKELVEIEYFKRTISDYELKIIYDKINSVLNK